MLNEDMLVAYGKWVTQLAVAYPLTPRFLCEANKILLSIVYPREIRWPQLEYRIPPTYLGQFGAIDDHSIRQRNIGRIYMYPLSWVNAVSVRKVSSFIQHLLATCVPGSI